ncbi:MAG: hypothetical protein ACE5HL_11125 [Terriglobia bacterium]
MKQFPPAWLQRLNELVKTVRRQQGWSDIQAIVEPPARPGYPSTLRLERRGALLIVPLDPHAVEQMMRTGQQGPLLIEIKQGFFRLLKAARHREKVFGSSIPPRKRRL